MSKFVISLTIIIGTIITMTLIYFFGGNLLNSQSGLVAFMLIFFLALPILIGTAIGMGGSALFSFGKQASNASSLSSPSGTSISSERLQRNSVISVVQILILAYFTIGFLSGWEFIPSPASFILPSLNSFAQGMIDLVLAPILPIILQNFKK